MNELKFTNELARMKFLDLTPEDYEINARVMDSVTDERYMTAASADQRVMAGAEILARGFYRRSRAVFGIEDEAQVREILGRSA